MHGAGQVDGIITVSFGTRGSADECRMQTPTAHLETPRTGLPIALWELHRAMAVGATVELQVLDGDDGRRPDPASRADALVDVVTGAGFAVEPASVVVSGDETGLRAVRERTLADTVGADMRVLVCGLNPSVYAADAGVGFARPGNRFWPAALGARLVSRDRDPLHALRAHHVGMTDQVKRATRAAADLHAAEYRDGLARIDRLVRWLQPGAVCFVGLTGWRAATGLRADSGLQPEPIGGRPVYVMPSTSGLNARTTLAELTDHLRAAMAIADNR